MPGVRWTTWHRQAVMTALRANNGAAARRAIEQDIEETSERLLAKATFARESVAVSPPTFGDVTELNYRLLRRNLPLPRGDVTI
jgi:DNA-binding GntR family transcriptional regulator